MLVAWTGHRPYYFGDPEQARRRVEAEAQALARRYAELRFLTGGQRGVDLWAAAAAVRLELPFEVSLPSYPEDFCVDWVRHEVDELLRLLTQAARVRVIDPHCQLGQAAYSRRNYLLATECELLVAVWTGLELGGTWETLRFARQANKPIRELRLAGSAKPPQPYRRGI